MNKLTELPKEKLVEIIEKLYVNLIKDPKYDIYSKAFFIEYLKQSLEIYKRYKNIKISLLLFAFKADKIDVLKKNIRKSDLLAKYDNAFVILLFETGELGMYKVRQKLENILNEKGVSVNITVTENIEEIIEEIESKIKIY
ncbi:hypothetical protein C3L23_03925 [Nautilia sp. PV-1]|uniref:hypothetical protein n=1 Tax=Nautilia sp. PV-1 TaxID=2579250 RepID=UPI000FDCD0C0|nr:hypothetical protein [Nautilia sp. PV-1]AZV46445.1 hypothetical protein C3L23_03925 [Nautilia sp. PV-1]